MNNKNKRKIYALEGLSSEVRAVTFAKCSRSPKSFRDIAAELTEEKSSEFHEKWVVGYGHSSVAEHAWISIAVENVSLLAVEALQNNRLFSYTEKSSRYQIYNRERIYIPEKIKKDKNLYKIYLDTIESLYDLYEKSVKPVQKIIYKSYPRKKGESKKMHEMRVRTNWIDVCRYLLPSCALANLGMTANARSWEYALVKLLSHPLDEVREIGDKLKEEALKVTPTLVKYADPNKFLKDSCARLDKLASDLYKGRKNTGKDLIELVDFDEKAEEKIIAALLYRCSGMSYKNIYQDVLKMGKRGKEKILEAALKDLGRHDKVPRELENTYFIFDILIDEGAYYDLKRNRMMTQIVQSLTTENSYFIPQAIIEAGLEKDYRKVMEKSDRAYREIFKKYPEEAQYIVAKGFARRFIMKVNLRELYYFCYYRGASPAGHFSYRYVGTRIYELVKEKFPLLMKYIPYIFEEDSKKLGKMFKYMK